MSTRFYELNSDSSVGRLWFIRHAAGGGLYNLTWVVLPDVVLRVLNQHAMEQMCEMDDAQLLVDGMGEIYSMRRLLDMTAAVVGHIYEPAAV